MDVGENDDFGEASLPQSEFVLILARTVGFLVAIVAVVIAILLMMTIRALIAFFLSKVGIIGLSMFFLWTNKTQLNLDHTFEELYLILDQTCTKNSFIMTVAENIISTNLLRSVCT